MMSFKKFGQCLLYTIVLLVLVACASPTPQTTLETYQVKTSSDYPPFEFFDQDNQLTGFDIDLIHEIASRSGFGVEVNHMLWSDLMAEMADCKQDHIYIAAMPVRQFPEGEETCYWLYLVGAGGESEVIDHYCAVAENPLYFSEPYYHTGQVILIQAGTTNINTKTDLANKIVGVQVGSIDEDEITGWGAEAYLFEDIGHAVDSLLNDEIDAVVLGYVSAWQYIDQYPGKLQTVSELVNEIPLVIGVCESSPNQDLLNQINAALGEMKSDGSLQTLTDIWFARE